MVQMVLIFTYESFLIARVVNVLFSVAAVWLIYLIGKKIFSRRERSFSKKYDKIFAGTGLFT